MFEFVVYLYQQGRLDAVESMVVMDSLVKRRPPIGRIAVREGLLSVKEVMTILAAQSDAGPRIRFGEMAVRMGYLTEGDLDWLLRTQQAEVNRDPVSTLAELTGLDPSELRGLYRRHEAA